MCLFTSALRASVNKSHIPSLPLNNLYIFKDMFGNICSNSQEPWCDGIAILNFRK